MTARKEVPVGSGRWWQSNAEASEQIARDAELSYAAVFPEGPTVEVTVVAFESTKRLLEHAMNIIEGSTPADKFHSLVGMGLNWNEEHGGFSADPPIMIPGHTPTPEVAVPTFPTNKLAERTPRQIADEAFWQGRDILQLCMTQNRQPTNTDWEVIKAGYLQALNDRSDMMQCSTANFRREPCGHMVTQGGYVCPRGCPDPSGT